MTEIIMSWPWYDRFVAGAIIGIMIAGPIYIMQKLDRIVKLLEQANEYNLKRERPDLFD